MAPADTTAEGAGPIRVELVAPERYDLAASQATLRWGPGDPTLHIDAARREVWRATRTPDGPATILMVQRDTTIAIDAWGAGASWVAAHHVALLGLLDRPDLFVPVEPIVRRLVARFPGIHLPSTLTVFERLAPTILHQLVTGKEAVAACRRLAERFGEPAPGPAAAVAPDAPALWVYPQPEVIRRLAPTAFTDLGILRKQAHTLRSAAERAHRLEALVGRPFDEVSTVLQALPGVGPWTAAWVLGSGFGDPDAVPTGDYWLPSMVAFALAGEARADDGRMLELLEPYRPHRLRVVALLKRAGVRVPRFGPRRALREKR